jgi:hypothetical protein
MSGKERIETPPAARIPSRPETQTRMQFTALSPREIKLQVVFFGASAGFDDGLALGEAAGLARPSSLL